MSVLLSELACLGLSTVVVRCVLSQGWKPLIKTSPLRSEGSFSFLFRPCAVFFFSRRRSCAGDVSLLAWSHVASASHPGQISKIQVATTCYLDTYEIDSQIPLHPRSQLKILAVIKITLQSFESAKYRSIEILSAICSEKYIPIGDRLWNDILSYDTFKGHTLESSISKVVM